MRFSRFHGKWWLPCQRWSCEFLPLYMCLHLLKISPEAAIWWTAVILKLCGFFCYCVFVGRWLSVNSVHWYQLLVLVVLQRNPKQSDCCLLNLLMSVDWHQAYWLQRTGLCLGLHCWSPAAKMTKNSCETLRTSHFHHLWIPAHKNGSHNRSDSHEGATKLIWFFMSN